MTQEELQAQEALQAKMQEATKGFVKQDAIDTVKAEIQASQETAIKSLEDVLAEQGNIINDLKESKVKAMPTKSIKEEIAEISKTQDFANFKKKSSMFQFELKAAAQMTIGTNITGETGLLPTPTMWAGYNPYNWNPATFWDYANKRTTDSPVISWCEEVSPDGTPATVAEAGAKGKIDWDILVEKSSAIKLASNIKISDEMLDDINFIGGEISDNLINRVRLATSGNIYAYIVANAGLTAISSTMADMGGSAPTMWQLVVACQQTLVKSNQLCTHIFLNPTDYARLLLTKGDSNIMIHINATSTNVNGVIVVSANEVPLDKFVACNLNKLNVFVYKPMTVEMGWVDADFTNNMKTFVGEHRVHYFIRNNDKTAFLYGDVTDALTTLTV